MDPAPLGDSCLLRGVLEKSWSADVESISMTGERDIVGESGSARGDDGEDPVSAVSFRRAVAGDAMAVCFAGD